MPACRLPEPETFHREYHGQCRSHDLSMHTRNLVPAVLLSLGLALPSWARTLVEAPPPPVVQEALPEQSEAPQKPIKSEVPTRGQLLYEDHCTACHESVVHVRETHRTHSLTGLREQVVNWAEYLHLHWGKEEVDDVVQHLNTHYYKFEPRD